MRRGLAKGLGTVATRHRDRRGARGGDAAGVRGFTLLEMAIATAIFGLLASGAILATTSWLQKQALDRTNKTLDRIESALTLYVIQNGELPCPYDPNQGTPGTFVSGCPATSGSASVGLVPYQQLGLQRADVLDGWNRYITYAVDGDAASPDWFFAPAANRLASLEALNPDASIQVLDASGNSCMAGGGPGPSVCAAYTVISHGESGRGAFMSYASPTAPRVSITEGGTANGAATAAERLNSPPAGTYGTPIFAAEHQGTANEKFGHIVRFRTSAQILRDAL